ncbi:hypothetical protein [Arcanobacterium haemolyticum]
MNGYELLAAQAIRAFLAKTPAESIDTLAEVIGCARSTFYQKLNGHRSFTVNELNALARVGVKFPPLSADLERRSK